MFTLAIPIRHKERKNPHLEELELANKHDENGQNVDILIGTDYGTDYYWDLVSGEKWGYRC